jgi:drug/metabolite transporter (DMT)-like permease
MSYILLALIAWFLFAVLSLLDKFLLNKPIQDDRVFTFYTGLFSIFVVLLFLPTTRIHSLNQVLFDIFCGFIFLVAQFFLFRALSKGEVSEVIPITGALVPVFALISSHYALGLNFTRNESIAFILLVFGTILISYRTKIKKGNLLYPILASIFFAIYYTAVKKAYVPFSENFGLVRLGSFVGSLLMLFSSEVRSSIRRTTHRVKNTTSGLFLTKEIAGGLGFIILNYAISKGNPALVNALQGFEYVMLFIFALLLSKKYPMLWHEHGEGHVLVRKFLAILLIVGGLVFLQFN